MTTRYTPPKKYWTKKYWHIFLLGSRTTQVVRNKSDSKIVWESKEYKERRKDYFPCFAEMRSGEESLKFLPNRRKRM